MGCLLLLPVGLLGDSGTRELLRTLAASTAFWGDREAGGGEKVEVSSLKETQQVQLARVCIMQDSVGFIEVQTDDGYVKFRDLIATNLNHASFWVFSETKPNRTMMLALKVCIEISVIAHNTAHTAMLTIISWHVENMPIRHHICKLFFKNLNLNNS